jgi:hypothetical protein
MIHATMLLLFSFHFKVCCEVEEKKKAINGEYLPHSPKTVTP